MADSADSGAAIDRVWRQALADPRAALEGRLDPGELTTVPLGVA